LNGSGEQRLFEIASGVKGCSFTNLELRGGVAGNPSSFPAVSKLGQKNEQLNGGAILNFGEIVLISGVLFKDNIAEGGYGGAIYSEYPGQVDEIEGCDFEDNQAERGGALYITNSEVWVAFALQITDSDFEDNIAYSEGGAIWADVPLHMEGIDFEDNEAYDGGAIAVYLPKTMGENTVLQFEDVDFIGNSATNRGGALQVFGKEYYPNVEENISMDETDFIKNVAGCFGGAMFGKNIKGILVKGSEFVRNEVRTNSDNTDTDCSEQEYADITGYGGAIALTNIESLEISNSAFTLNKADTGGDSLGGNGGAIAISSADGRNQFQGDLRIEATTFESNEASLNGGAIYLSETTGTKEFDSVQCNNNTATGEGGCLYHVPVLNSMYLAWEMVDVTMQFNEVASTTSNGGAVSVSVPNQSNRIWGQINDGCRFSNNEASRGGGALYSPLMDITLPTNDSTILFDNMAEFGEQYCLPGSCEDAPPGVAPPIPPNRPPTNENVVLIVGTVAGVSVGLAFFGMYAYNRSLRVQIEKERQSLLQQKSLITTIEVDTTPSSSRC
jgi:predicted outer membrane repeat protein